MWQNRRKLEGDNESYGRNSFTHWTEKGYNTRGLTYTSSPHQSPRHARYAESTLPHYSYDYSNVLRDWNNDGLGTRMTSRMAVPYKLHAPSDSVSSVGIGERYRKNKSTINWKILTLIILLILTIIAAIILAIYYGSSSGDRDSSATTTELPTTQPPTEAAVETIQMEVSLEMNNLEFTADYNDPSSSAFQTLATEVCDEITKVYGAQDSLQSHKLKECTVTGFRNGSVIADVDVTSDVQTTDEVIDDNTFLENAKSSFTESLAASINEGTAFADRGIDTNEISVEATNITPDTDVDTTDPDGSGEDELDSEFLRA